MNKNIFKENGHRCKFLLVENMTKMSQVTWTSFFQKKIKYKNTDTQQQQENKRKQVRQKLEIPTSTFYTAFSNPFPK